MSTTKKRTNVRT